MADPVTLALLAASTGLQIFGQISAGKAQQEASRLNAFQIKTDQALNKTQAMQMSRARKEEYDLATSANIAAFAAAGRDIGSDRSVQAFLDRQKEIISQDTSRIDQQIQFQNMKSKSAAMAERRRGDNALTASLFSAVGTASQGIYQYETVK